MFNNRKETIDIDYFNQMIRDFVDKTLKIGNVIYHKNKSTNEYVITLQNGKIYKCNLNFKEVESNKDDYQKIILAIKEILSNEEMCAEAMVSEIGELIF